MAGQPCYVVLLFLVLYFSRCLAQRNITVDDNDPSIVYSGQDWEVSPVSLLDMGGTHHFSANDPNASAGFTFAGAAVYVMSPLWPFPVGAQVQLDNQTPVTLNLTDPNRDAISNSEGLETVESAVVWSSGTIPNATHTLTITRSPNFQFVIVDAIIYTILNPSHLSSSSPSSPSSSSSSSSTTQVDTSPTNTSSGDSNSTPNLAIELLLGFSFPYFVVISNSVADGFPFGLLILLPSLCFGALCMCFPRNKHPNSEARTTDVSYQEQNASYPRGQMTHSHQAPDFSKSPSYTSSISSTLTEKFIPWITSSDRPPGTSSKSSSTSRPSVKTGCYTPPQGTCGVQLSYASDVPVAANAAAILRQYPQTSSNSASESTETGMSSVPPPGN